MNNYTAKFRRWVASGDQICTVFWNSSANISPLSIMRMWSDVACRCDTDKDIEWQLDKITSEVLTYGVRNEANAAQITWELVRISDYPTYPRYVNVVGNVAEAIDAMTVLREQFQYLLGDNLDKYKINACTITLK